MISLLLTTPHEMQQHVARATQTKRLALNLSQKTLSERAGVSFGVLKKFEQTGKISLESLLKLALVLGALNEFSELFKPIPLEQHLSLDELLQEKTRKRGRR